MKRLNAQLVMIEATLATLMKDGQQSREISVIKHAAGAMHETALRWAEILKSEKQ